jgi:hypothetical protein
MTSTNRPMDCTDIRALLSGLIDGEIDEATRHAAERHLADCSACRALVSETESLDALLAAEGAALAATGTLPEGFQGAVLARTVYAQARRSRRQWTSWTGWFAAAATLALAVTLWVMDQQRAVREVALQGAGQPEAAVVRVANAYPRSSVVRSWTYEGPIAATPESAAPPAPAPDSLAPDAAAPYLPALDSRSAPEPRPVAVVRDLDDAADAATLALAHAAAPASDAAVPVSAISQDDVLAIHAAAMLIDTLSSADDMSFRDVEWIRETAEYDGLLPRLHAARSRVPAADRPAVLAAEGVLHRIVNGPLSLDDVRDMRDSVATLELSAELEAIGAGPVPPRGSL